MSEQKINPNEHWVIAFARAVWNKKFLLIIMVALVALLPMAMAKESIVLRKALFTSIGVDYIDNEYHVYGEIFKFGFDPFAEMERELYIGKGTSLQGALDDLERNLGKTPSFSHCSLFIIGKGLVDRDLLQLMKPFALKPQMSNSCIVLYSESDLGQLIQTSLDLGDPRAGRLQFIANFNKRTRGFVSTNMERFFKDSMRGDRTVKVAKVEESDGEIINDGSYKVLKFPESRVYNAS